MQGNRKEFASMQSDFYRDQYRKTLRWLTYVVFLIFILIGLVAFLLWYRPTQQFYASTTEGELLTMPAASES